MLPGRRSSCAACTRTTSSQQIKARRISVLVCVPKILDVLRDHVLAARAGGRRAAAGRTHSIRGAGGATAGCIALFGLKFWAFVVGAAPLDPELEAFWGRLGFVGRSRATA